MKDFQRHYSGKHSQRFWARVNKNKSSEAYSLACALQDIEEIILTRIHCVMLHKKVLDNSKPQHHKE